VLGYDTARRAAADDDAAYRRLLTNLNTPATAEQLAARSAQQGAPRRGGLAGFLDALPGDSGIADWMNRDRGPDTSRDKIPQRGGIADDAARVIEHPGKSIFGWLGDRASNIADLPGNISQIGRTVDRATERGVGAADRAIGDPTERFLSGETSLNVNAPLMPDEDDARDRFRIPDFVTGRGDGSGQGGLADSIFGSSIYGILNPNLKRVDDTAVVQKPGNVFGPQGARAALGGAAKDLLMDSMKTRMLKKQAAAHTAALAKDKAIMNFRQASNDNFIAKRNQLAREAMAKKMLAAGRSPFDDERNARNAAIYGAWA